MVSSSFLLAGIASHAALVSANAQFSGNFELSDLAVDSTFQAQPDATSNSTISFVFSDQDRPAPIHCCIDWAVGLQPPSAPKPNFCEDSSVATYISHYDGTQNFTLELAHTYTDDSVGEYPYNKLTKFATLKIAFPGTADYECNPSGSYCSAEGGKTIIAVVDRAIA